MGGKNTIQLCRFYKCAIKVFVLPLVCSMTLLKYMFSILEISGLHRIYILAFLFKRVTGENKR